MPPLLDNPANLLVLLFTGIVGSLVTFLVARGQQRLQLMQQQTSARERIVNDAIRLKQEYQEDYEILRQRLTDQDQQLLALRSRLATLETENYQLRQQLLAAGIPVVPPGTPAPATRPQRPPRTPHTPRVIRPTLMKREQHGSEEDGA
jgi:uncharacterized membrane protein YccC